MSISKKCPLDGQTAIIVLCEHCGPLVFTGDGVEVSYMERIESHVAADINYSTKEKVKPNVRILVLGELTQKGQKAVNAFIKEKSAGGASFVFGQLLQDWDSGLMIKS